MNYFYNYIMIKLNVRNNYVSHKGVNKLISSPLIFINLDFYNCNLSPYILRPICINTRYQTYSKTCNISKDLNQPTIWLYRIFHPTSTCAICYKARSSVLYELYIFITEQSVRSATSGFTRTLINYNSIHKG